MAKTVTKIKSKGVMLLNLAVAIYLFATGVMGILKESANEIGVAVNEIFKGGGSVPEVLTIVLSVVAIAAGIFLIIKLFGVSISNTEMLLIILGVVWLVFILMIDIIYPLSSDFKPAFLPWLRSLGAHAMVLAAILTGTSKFGI
jgi:uncharacterized membrane protein YphA (DoxX/SURF4 family)